MMPYPLLALLLIVIGLFAPQPAQTADKLMLVWVENGDLYAWKEGDSSAAQVVSGGVFTPHISPDGAHIAFTRGDGDPPISLWLVNADGNDAHIIADWERLSLSGSDQPYVGDVGWVDANTLFLNTFLDNMVYDDLRRLDITTGEIRLVLPPGEGGRFTISPDGKYTAVRYRGTYGNDDGRIRVLDAEGIVQGEPFAFVGVSTGSEIRFYPAIFWESDSSAFRVAIPDPDLLYNEAAVPPTVLWRITTAGEAAQIGSVQSSFFGLPAWSADGTALTYMTRGNDPASNRFDLVTAMGDGTNPVVYASGEVNEILSPTWIPDSNTFVYAQGTLSIVSYYVGSPGQLPRVLPDGINQIYFVDGSRYVYSTASELRLGHLDSDESQFIAPLDRSPSSVEVRLVQSN